MKTGMFMPLAAPVLAALIALLATAPAAAQESLERGAQVLRVQDGPYTVAMWILPEAPRIGTLNFTVTVESVAASALVQGAVVEVVATDPDGEPDWLSPAISYLPNPTSYVGNGEFSRAGTWRLEVRVRGPEGAAAATVSLEVRGLGRTNATAGALAFAGALLVVTAGGLWLVFSIRRSQRRRSHTDTR